MPTARIGAVVRLKEDLPTLDLRREEQGVVVSVWLSPGGFLCEVEFSRNGGGCGVRTLLRAGQLEVVER